VGSGACDLGQRQNRLTAGLKEKDLCGIPWRVALALQADGWYLRQDIIWSKPNPMPESVTDRCTKAHEYVFLLTKSGSSLFWIHRDGRRMDSKPAPDYRYEHQETGREYLRAPKNWKTLREFDEPVWRRINLWSGHDYYYDQDSILEPIAQSSAPRLAQNVAAQIGSVRANGGAKTNGTMKAVRRNDSPLVHGNLPGRSDGGRACNSPGQVYRNKRSVWTVNTQPFSDAHFAVYPPELIRPCILAGCPRGGVVLDPFGGSGTTGMVSLEEGRRAILCELNPDYVDLIRQRCEPSELERKRLRALRQKSEELPLFGGPIE
jgi:site-specific DNA-methyltransferase (adenine-specific)